MILVKIKKKHQRYLKFHLITNGYFIKHIGKTTSSILDITYEYDKANYGSLDDNDDGTLQETDKHLELFEGLKKEIQNIFKKHNKFHHVDWGDYAVKTVFGHWIPKYLVQYLNEWNEQKYKSDITSFWDSQELVIKKEVHKHISNYMSKNRLTEKWFKNILGSRGYDGFLKNYNIKESIRVDCLKDEDLRDKISKDIVDFIMEDKKQEFLKYGQELVLRYEISDISDFIEINYVKIIDKFYDDLCNPQNCHQKIPNKKDRISDIIKKYEGNWSVIQENLKPDDFLES